MEKPVTLDAPLTSLPGIGPQRAALFARLNVRTSDSEWNQSDQKPV